MIVKKAVNNPLDYAKINEWYQIVVKFTSEDGEKRYHIVEMNRKGTGWKFIRFDG